MTIALAPLGGWVAVTGQIDAVALLFYFSVALWTAGFDVIYACQDIDYDRRSGLYSIPARFGLAKALWIAKCFHACTALGLISLIWFTQLGWWYLAGMIIASAILFYEHRLVSPEDMSKLNTAFFTMNGTLSIVVFAFTILDLAVF
ncbi:hypothetical protein XYCOK13_03750 [Xylanibacillus composti]|uniref:4-hydroxybenzoate polyprenyltransferase n=1 Tax=Xylanibacillus composti TaxID=1572762 RepID=A0A8J4M1I0_9BACL|nr:hypothetical protein XYCOK13_03750 [Xylanibacillus composti]